MKVYKFGGASVKDAQSIKNIAAIIERCKEDLVIVVSAMGKTTNSLETLANVYYGKGDWKPFFDKIVAFHRAVIAELFILEDDQELLVQYVMFEDDLFQELKKIPSLNFDYDYDRIVSFGELFSTTIIAAYLKKIGCQVGWTDSRGFIRTSNDFREGKIDWELSKRLISESIDFSQAKIFLAQGFIGSTTNNQTTTLGREGSDFSAAAIAYLMDGTDVTIWKDVAGVLNADPRWYSKAVLLPEMSYNEAIELSFYGAQVIHPKTLKPLENKNIPLYVRSFSDPDGKGTIIGFYSGKIKIPILIKKTEQILLSIAPLDFSFVVEDNLKEIFEIFSKYRIKVNQMQISALNFSVCASYDERKFENLLADLRSNYRVTYNLGLELLTIRHYNPEIIEEMVNGYKVLMEQKNRDTAWFVMKQNGIPEKKN